MFSLSVIPHDTQRILGGEITGFKRARKHTRTHTHAFLIPLCLIRNASSPEPQTQFSTLLWAPAVSPPARKGNRQHPSPGLRDDVMRSVPQKHTRSRAGRSGPKQTNKQTTHGVAVSLSHSPPAVFAPLEESSLLASRDKLNLSTCTAAPAAGRSKGFGIGRTLQHSPHPSPPRQSQKMT